MKANLIIGATISGVVLVWILMVIGVLRSKNVDQRIESPDRTERSQSVGIASASGIKVNSATDHEPSIDDGGMEVDGEMGVVYENEGDLPPKPVALGGEEIKRILNPEASIPAIPSNELPKLWKDKSKKFSTAASLKAFDHENGQVSLLKADGSVVTIPIDKLSDEDQEAVLNTAAPRVDPSAKALIGKVTEVLDGDTVRLSTFAEFTKTIRLNEIDAPETDQPFGANAKEELARLCLGKQVRVEYLKVDQLGRISGELYVGDLWVNGYLVANGFAWRYERYAKNTGLPRIDGHARASRSGLWAVEPCISPEAWRGGVRPGLRGGIPSDREDGVVYLTAKKLFYHFPGCRYLSESSIEIPESVAKEMYPPCSLCIPKEGKRD